MRQVEKEEAIKCRLGELSAFTFNKRLRIRYFDAPDILGPEQHQIDDQLRNAASSDIGSVSGVMLWSAPLQSAIPRLAKRDGRIVYTPRIYHRYFVNLKERSYDDYLAGFSAKTRSTLKRKIRKFREQSGGKIDFRTYGTPDDIDRFYRDATSISRVSYQHVMFDMGLPDSPAFRQQLSEAAARGAVRAYVLYLKDEPVAYLYCPFEDGVLSYQYLGYVQEHRHLSPGTVLQMLVFERLFEDADAEYFDFTQGGAEGSHKDFFSTDSTLCADIFVLKSTAANATFVLVHYVTDQLSRYAGIVLAKLRLKRHIKSAIRLAKGAIGREENRRPA